MNNITLDRELNVIDLFCGAGGLSMGFQEDGYNVVAGVDNDEKALDTWKLNHKNGVTINTDISSVNPEKLKSRLPKDNINVIIGGPPCKDFSNANRMVDLGRNNLVLLYAKLVDKINPDIFLMENVKQITTTDKDILNELYSILQDNFSISHKILDAADYGVPQHRIRAFVIGIKDSILNVNEPKFPEPTHGPDSQSDRCIRSSGSAISDIQEPKSKSKYEVKSKHSDLLEDIPPGMNYSFYTEKLGHPEPVFEWRSKFSDYLYKADPEKPIRTLKAKPGASSGPLHWNNRRFTEAELKRLQTFPDDFEFSTDSYSQVIKMIGNSVPPSLSYALARSIRSQISEFNTIDEDKELNFYSRRRTDTEEYKNKARKQIEKLYK